MSKKTAVPDAWDDDWEATADVPSSSTTQPVEEKAEKKGSSRATKAQRRAQQAEFNRQLWQEAEGPRETFHFLETRPNATVPLKSEFKPPPILLSRKAPSHSNPPNLLARDVNNLSLRNPNDSSEDEDEAATPELTLEERKAKAAKEREEKQRKYEERREQLFGPSVGSGASSPGDVTPPPSRSGTPSSHKGGRGGGRGRGGSSGSGSRNHGSSGGRKETIGSKKELFDPTAYSPKPDSTYLHRRADGFTGREQGGEGLLQPVRAPKGPDGSGRGGFGFGTRGGMTL